MCRKCLVNVTTKSEIQQALNVVLCLDEMVHLSSIVSQCVQINWLLTHRGGATALVNTDILSF